MGAGRLIVVDTSVLVAIILGEAEAGPFAEILTARECRMSTVSVMETEIVIRGRKDDSLVPRVRQVLAEAPILICPFDDDQARLASAAYGRFGKGFHPARLNMGDCAAYALARSLDAPLLYKGDDFARTDIASALTTG